MGQATDTITERTRLPISVVVVLIGAAITVVSVFFSLRGEVQSQNTRIALLEASNVVSGQKLEAALATQTELKFQYARILESIGEMKSDLRVIRNAPERPQRRGGQR